MNDRQRHGVFVAGAAVATTVIVLDIVQAVIPQWRTDFELIFAVIAVAAIFISKRPP